MKLACSNHDVSSLFIPERPIDNKSALIQVMAWHLTGEKPLPYASVTYHAAAVRSPYGSAVYGL